jgi:hypothetical protein
MLKELNRRNLVLRDITPPDAFVRFPGNRAGFSGHGPRNIRAAPYKAVRTIVGNIYQLSLNSEHENSTNLERDSHEMKYIAHVPAVRGSGRRLTLR